MRTRLGRHLPSIDPDVPPDQKGRRFCTCGAREDHERHDVPRATPEQRAHDAAVLGETEGTDR